MIKGINIIFPVFNEELRLENGITKTYEYCKKELDIPFILTIVDNHSYDRTKEIATCLSEKYPEVNYRRIEEKGVGIAFKTGILENKMDIVGYMDCDLSTDLNYLKIMIELFKKGDIEYVNGSRFSNKSNVEGRKWYRKITSFGLRYLLKFTLDMKASDALCGFTFLLKDKAIDLVKECGKEYGWFYTVEFLLRAERKKIVIYELAVDWVEDYNTTVKIFSTIKNYLVNIVKLRKQFVKEGIL